MRAVWLWLMFAAVAAAGEPLVGIGHLPIAVRNLQAASDAYRGLGFTLKPGHRHDDSILNNHVKFADGTELELITASDPRDSVAVQYLRMLDAGDGPAFVALEWADSGQVRAALKRAGIGFDAGDFFTLTDPRLGYLFFGGDNHSPTDRPEHFAHANTAYSLLGVWIADQENPAIKQLLHALGARLVAREVQLPARAHALEAKLRGNGSITLLPRSQRLIADRPIVGAVLCAKDLARVAASAREAGIEDVRPGKGPGYISLTLPPSATHGLWLEFRQLDL